MIQFNLLPDVKAEYVHIQRMQRTIMVASGLVTAVAIFVLLVLVVIVDGFQKHTLNNLTNQAKQDSAQLEQIPDLNKILTVQNQLESLPKLHDQKPVASRLFGYLSQITPSTVTISDFKIDFTQNTISITGEAPTLADVNTYVDTLKFTTFSIKGQKSSNKAFSEVVLSSFGLDSRGATYILTLNFNPTIFSETQNVTLSVPNTITTRSVVDQPQALFRKSAATNNGT